MRKRSFGVMPKKRKAVQSAARGRLIDAARRLLQSLRPDEISTGMVLAEADVARGTLYLHFEDFSELLEIVLLEMFSSSVEENIKSFGVLVQKSSSKRAFLKGVHKLLSESQGPDRRRFRFGRLRLIAYSEQNPRFADLLADEQSRLNKKFEDIFASMRKKGWLNKSLDLESVTVFIQAFTLGQVVDDVARKKMSPAAWNRLISQIVEKVVIAN